MKLEEKQVKANYEYQGKVINVRCDDAMIANGTIVKREVVEHPGGVGIALEDEDGKYFMVRQFRYGQMEVMLEFPAGKREKGEDKFITAQREIVEETGYEGYDWKYLGYIAPTPAYDEEKIFMYYAKKGKYVGQHFDDDENIALCKYSIDELVDMIMKQEITDAKTVAMTFMVKEMKNNESKY